MDYYGVNTARLGFIYCTCHKVKVIRIDGFNSINQRRQPSVDTTGRGINWGKMGFRVPAGMGLLGWDF